MTWSNASLWVLVWPHTLHGTSCVFCVMMPLRDLAQRAILCTAKWCHYVPWYVMWFCVMVHLVVIYRGTRCTVTCLRTTRRYVSWYNTASCVLLRRAVMCLVHLYQQCQRDDFYCILIQSARYTRDCKTSCFNMVVFSVDIERVKPVSMADRCLIETRLRISGNLYCSAPF